MGNTDLLQIQADVARVKEENAQLLVQMLDRYEERRQQLAFDGVPVVAFCGPGRCGKDLAAKWLALTYGLRYVGSISYAISPLIAKSLGVSREEAFAKRHDDRMYWFEWCNALRKDDPTLLAKLTLGENDMVAGFRGDVELHSCKSSGVVDLTIWVDNPRVDVDPSLEFSIDDCDLVIRNAGGKLEYFNKLKILCNYLGFKDI